jgi:hypothetical protein
MSEFKLNREKLPAIASELGVELKELEPFFYRFWGIL